MTQNEKDKALIEGWKIAWVKREEELIDVRVMGVENNEFAQKKHIKFSVNSDKAGEFIDELLKAQSRLTEQRVREECAKIVKSFIRKTKPSHGTCCTCPTCGSDNDRVCNCPRNELCEEIISKILSNNPKQNE